MNALNSTLTNATFEANRAKVAIEAKRKARAAAKNDRGAET